jgi:hypothetical protein
MSSALICPERNVVRWETEKEYGFERFSDRTALLAASLIKRFTKDDAQSQ